MAGASPEKRKWSARAWWLGLHVYVYAVLAHSGSLSLHALPPSWLALIVAVAVVNTGCYVQLQRSTPGFVERDDACDLEAGRVDVAVVTIDDSELASDSDSLVTACNGDSSNANDAIELHFCELCQLTQPLRAKHCKDCGKCVRQYDHHCDCAGTCVGEQNRRLFVSYLAVQALEGVVMISVAADAVTLQDSVDAWFTVNWPYLLAWLAVACELLIAVPLLVYQTYLISTNQTSWEHARRSSITYLRGLAYDDRSPFDRGCMTNWRVFVSGDDATKWVHRGGSGSGSSSSGGSSSGAVRPSRALRAVPVALADDDAVAASIM